MIFHKIFPQEFPARISHKIFLQEFPTRISHKIFPSWILIDWLPITLFEMLNFHQSVPFLNWLFPLPVLQDFPKLDPDWFSPHHPIPDAQFPPITAFLKLAFSPPPCPARFSRKNFPQDFPELDPD